ncbi:nitroreductase family protein [Jatrophihabitans telluris]|uniref:Nitroreductase family protein n=1 Tax=Jatrophihabitans telluris TaxID=2038343 RepID=A0ABY4QZ20_9ACTN|nr:nitroreductase family protein [Jatrophihabitans telluris]UQX88547.1 nitroreductase family protein [Jatrophihabitans telluris]
MEFTETVRRRRMVRNYDPERAVSREQVDALLALAIRAPSAGFSQGWRFLVLDDATARQRFWTATADGDEPPDRWLAGMQSAPALIVCLSDKQAYLDRYAAPDKGWTDRDEARWPVPYWDVDTGMAAMLILLGAVDRGLAACFFGVPPAAHRAVRTAFDVAEQLRFVGVISLGYGLPDPKSPSLKRGRRTLDEVVTYNPAPATG